MIMYTFLIKPTNNCNLRCKYCFISNAVKSSSDMMTIEMAKFAIKQIADFIGGKGEMACKILWHGGEPLLWNASKYESVLSHMNEVYPHIHWDNSMQTNLTLLTDEHLKIFKKYNVKISTSMDGYENLHDSVRVKQNGTGTHSELVSKLHLLASNKIRVGLIVVLNAVNFDKIVDIYDYFKRYNQGFRVNPLIDSGEACCNKDLAITPEQYAEAMIQLFDYWINDESAIPVSNFIDWTSSLVTRATSSCSFVKNCQRTFTVIEPNGDISVCDRLCGEKDFVFGKIEANNFTDILQNKQKIFENRADILRETDCRDCKYWNICYGGCPAESIGGVKDINRKSKHCLSYRKIFDHIEKTILENHIINNLIKPVELCN